MMCWAVDLQQLQRRQRTLFVLKAEVVVPMCLFKMKTVGGGRYGQRVSAKPCIGIGGSLIIIKHTISSSAADIPRNTWYHLTILLS